MSESKNKKIIQLIKNLVEQSDLVFYGGRFFSNSDGKFLEIEIDNLANSIDMKEIEWATKKIQFEINQYDPNFFNGFNLLITSPGVNRLLKSELHYKLSLGKFLRIKYKKNKGSEVAYGKLVDINPIKLDTKNKQIIIKNSEIIEGRWENNEKIK